MVDETQPYETLRVAAAGDHIAVVTLNRPEALNAINATMCLELARAFEALETDPDTWLIVLAAAGRAFCVGADLKERQGMTLPQVRHRMELALRALDRISRCRKPSVAAIHGYAFGGGFELALACDLLVAAESALFALPETSLGIIPGAGGTQRLPRLIGALLAKELIFTGRRVPARLALEYGMLNRVVPEGDLTAEVMALAREITANAPLSVWQAKRAIDAGLDMELDSGIRFEAEAYQSCLTSSDRDEGLAAFREKRKPSYKGE